MKLIVGLGNPGPEHNKDRHNLGFMAADALASEWGVSFALEKKLKSEIVATMRAGQTVLLCKPQTFMNLSGVAVQKICNFYKIDSTDVIVISDDIDLDFGVIRVRHSGSAGGHNGLVNIIDSIGADFTRIRVGIGSNRPLNIPAEGYVLQAFTTEEQSKLPDIFKAVSDEIEKLLKAPTLE